MKRIETRTWRTGLAALAAAGLISAGAALATAGEEAHGGDASRAAAAKKKPRKHEVLLVGNNWEGTADILDPKDEFRRIARVNIVPDIEERLGEIVLDPVRLGYFLAIRELVGEGNDQLVDDLYTSNDGRTLIVSRPSLRDVVSIDLATGELVWRFVVDGQRSDHMAVSPDGTQVAVSASTGNVVHVLDVETGAEVGGWDSGDSPHEITYSADGSRIFHASIGMVYTPADDPILDTTKGERVFQVVDAKTYEVLSSVDMGEKLEEAGYPNMSSAVRPMAITPDEKTAYLQVSFFHGFVEYDLVNQKVVRVVDLPVSEEAAALTREQYLLDSAHHGIAISGNGKRLCVAGTMSDYAAIVSLKDFSYDLIEAGEKPYWSTTSRNGKRCYVSWSGTDTISVINYRKRKEIARIPVGDHPQRIRTGVVRSSFIAAHGRPASPAG